MLKTVNGLQFLAIATLSSFLAHPSNAESVTLTVVERATTDAVTDTGATGDSPGDILTFANELFDKENTTKVGTDNGYCIRTAAGMAWECAFTNTLEGGQISVTGSFLDAGDSVLTIAGGTGAYKGASGEMLLHARDAEGAAYDFVFTVNF